MRIRRATRPGEWVGVRVPLRSHIVAGRVVRPEIILWVERPENRAVGSTVVEPEGPVVSLGQTLLDAMWRPLYGPPRRPRRIRVADESQAAEIRAAVGRDVEVRAAPTPEIEALGQEVTETWSVVEENGVETEGNDGVSLPTLRALFRTAKQLYLANPWGVLREDQTLCLDIPELAIEGACVSLTGMVGEPHGFLVVPSLAHFEQMVRGIETWAASGKVVDFGTDVLALIYARGRDVLPSMRHLVAASALPIAGPDAYPAVEHRDRTGKLRLLCERDVRAVSVCAGALTSLLMSHRAKLERKAPRLRESFTYGEGNTVRLAIPYQRHPLVSV